MTDNETIKALKCCKMPVGSGACNGCSLKDIRNKRLIDDDKSCTTILLENVLDLINRQKAENEARQAHINLLKAEIERLKNECFCLANELDAYKDVLDTTVTEARKEFAERLKAKHCERLGYNGGTYRMTGNDIDNLLAEMESERE